MFSVQCPPAHHSTSDYSQLRLTTAAVVSVPDTPAAQPATRLQSRSTRCIDTSITVVKLSSSTHHVIHNDCFLLPSLASSKSPHTSHYTSHSSHVTHDTNESPRVTINTLDPSPHSSHCSTCHIIHCTRYSIEIITSNDMYVLLRNLSL